MLNSPQVVMFNGWSNPKAQTARILSPGLGPGKPPRECEFSVPLFSHLLKFLTAVSRRRQMLPASVSELLELFKGASNSDSVKQSSR